jgi:hypothetical protein
MLGLVIVLAVAAAPAAIIGILSGIGIYYLTGVVAIVPPALIVGVVLLAEAFIASGQIGRLLDRTDIAAIDASE